MAMVPEDMDMVPEDTVMDTGTVTKATIQATMEEVVHIIDVKFT